MERMAQCHCGMLKAIAAGEPERVYVCHCRACQRRTGAVVRSRFCLNCGSNVFWEGDRSPDYYGIAVGCFADPGFPPPFYSPYVEAKHPWIGVATATEHYPQGRPAHLPIGR